MGSFNGFFLVCLYFIFVTLNIFNPSGADADSLQDTYPVIKFYGANMGPTWGQQDPGWPHEPCYLGRSIPWLLKPCKQATCSHDIDLSLMVVLVTVAPCLSKALHTNGYKKETLIRFDNCFNTNVNKLIHVENQVILMNKCIWNLNCNIAKQFCSCLTWSRI